MARRHSILFFEEIYKKREINAIYKLNKFIQDIIFMFFPMILNKKRNPPFFYNLLPNEETMENKIQQSFKLEQNELERLLYEPLLDIRTAI